MDWDFRDSPESKFLFPFSIWLWDWTWDLDSGLWFRETEVKSQAPPFHLFFNHSLKKAHYLKIYKCAWVLVVGSFYTFLDESKERRRELLKVYPNMKCNQVHKDKSNSHITVYWIMVQYCFVKESSAITPSYLAFMQIAKQRIIDKPDSKSKVQCPKSKVLKPLSKFPIPGLFPVNSSLVYI